MLSDNKYDQLPVDGTAQMFLNLFDSVKEMIDNTIQSITNDDYKMRYFFHSSQ